MKSLLIGINFSFIINISYPEWITFELINFFKDSKKISFIELKNILNFEYLSYNISRYLIFNILSLLL